MCVCVYERVCVVVEWMGRWGLLSVCAGLVCFYMFVCMPMTM